MQPLYRAMRGDADYECGDVLKENLKILHVMYSEIFEDALFAAIAAIGFAAISKPPKRAYAYCALVAAAGHSLRFILMNTGYAMPIIPATLLAAFAVGGLAVLVSAAAKFPAETCLFPALLPMIPGIYAYKTFGAMALSLLSENPGAFSRYFDIFAYNGMMCLGILLSLVIGATLPIFIFGKVSFQATR